MIHSEHISTNEVLNTLSLKDIQEFYPNGQQDVIEYVFDVPTLKTILSNMEDSEDDNEYSITMLNKWITELGTVKQFDFQKHINVSRLVTHLNMNKGTVETDITRRIKKLYVNSGILCFTLEGTKDNTTCDGFYTETNELFLGIKSLNNIIIQDFNLG